jgi:endo-1,4-beta-xylanase
MHKFHCFIFFVLLSRLSYAEAPHTQLHHYVQFPIGVAVAGNSKPYAFLNSARRKEIVQNHFSQVTAEDIMKPESLHPGRYQYKYGEADELINYARTYGKTVHGHVLVWHSQIPDWMKTFQGDTKAWFDMLYEHSFTISKYFSGRVKSWDVVNEAILDTGSWRGQEGTYSLWYEKTGSGFIEAAFNAARAGAPDAELYYTDYNIESSQPKADAIVKMVTDFKKRGIPIDGVGFQMHIKGDYPSIEILRLHLKKIADLGIKVKFTEFDIRLNDDLNTNSLTPQMAAQQKNRYRDIVRAYMEVVPSSQQGGITFWGVGDKDSWILDFKGHADWPLLFDDNLNAKPALQGVANGLANMY